MSEDGGRTGKSLPCHPMTCNGEALTPSDTLQELSGRYTVVASCSNVHCASYGLAYPTALLAAFRPTNRRRPYALVPPASPQFMREVIACLGLAGLALFPANVTAMAKCAYARMPEQGSLRLHEM